MTQMERFKFYMDLTRQLNEFPEAVAPWCFGSQIGRFEATAGIRQLRTGMGLTLNFERDQVLIQCIWPHHAGVGGPVVSPATLKPPTTPPRLTCTVSHGVKEIAREIITHLLPRYTALYAKCKEVIALEQARADTQRINWEMLLRAGKDILINNSTPATFMGKLHLCDGVGAVRMEPYDNTVDIELRSIPMEIALAMLRYLAVEDKISMKLKGQG